MSTTIQPTADLAKLFEKGGMQHTNVLRSPSTFVERPNQNGYDAFPLETAQQVTNRAMLIPEPEETRFNKKEAASVIGSTARRASFDNSRFFPEAAKEAAQKAAQEARKIAEQIQTPKEEHFQRKEATNQILKAALIAQQQAPEQARFEAEVKGAVNTVLDKAIELSKAQASFFFPTKEDRTSCASEAQQKAAFESAISIPTLVR